MKKDSNKNPTKGWSKSGDKCIIEENKTLYSKRFTIGLMITPEKALHFKIVENGMKTEDFMDIVKEYNKESNINNDKTLFLDNASIHKTKTFINYMNETKMKVLYNVPYHSDKNPIEYIFSMLRKTIQRETFSTLEDLESIVNCFCFMIESEKIKNCFNHAFSLFSKTIEKLENKIK
jgi:transposase